MRVKKSITMTQGDLLPILVEQLTDYAGNPIDLSTAAVTFSMVDYYSGAIVVNASPASVLQNPAASPTKGLCAYYWTPGDTGIASLYQAYFQVSLGGNIMTVPSDGSFFVRIKPAV